MHSPLLPGQRTQPHERGGEATIGIVETRVAIAVLITVIIFLAGYRLSRSGKPYSGIVLNVHKLVALVAVVLFVYTLQQASTSAALATVTLGAGIATALVFLGLFVSGGLLSARKIVPPIVSKFHRIAPYLVALATAVTLYLLPEGGLPR